MIVTDDQLLEIQAALSPDDWAKCVRYLKMRGVPVPRHKVSLRLSDGVPVEIVFYEDGHSVLSLSIDGQIITGNDC